MGRGGGEDGERGLRGVGGLNVRGGMREDLRDGGRQDGGK